MNMKVPFFSLKNQIKTIKGSLDLAISNVYRDGSFILGSRVKEFERLWAKQCGAKYAIGVGSGTDALFLTLKALNVGHGDEVIVPVLTAPPTAVAVRMTGATPVFADVAPENLLIDTINWTQCTTSRTRAVIPVHLYGCPVDMSRIADIASRNGIFVIEDAAQAHGTLWNKRPVGSFGSAGIFSFYPTKNLGAFGDAGIVVTSDKIIHEKIKKMRDYGRDENGTLSESGINSRLDELQAAVLLVKLDYLEKWNSLRRRNASLYMEKLADLPLTCPKEPAGGFHVYHQFVIQTQDRDRLRQYLKSRHIDTAIHYPKLLSDQPVFLTKNKFPNAGKAVERILSLPVYPELEIDAIDTIVKSIHEFYNSA